MAPPTVEGESERPRYDPVQRKAVWLSSEAVKAEIVKLAQAGADKAVCWDMHCAITRLEIERTTPPISPLNALREHGNVGHNGFDGD